MPTFDGDNLVITLDSGVTEIDVINGIYEPWKDWLLTSPTNRGYPQAFISDGGNPLSSIINQGSYIFLQNNSGWRIKPPEEDITIYLTGNLAVADTTLDAFTPTIGGFTAAILGLQPVTQGVTESMAQQLAFNVFQNAVAIDAINGYPGTGEVAGHPIGTRKAPSNNLIDGHTIMNREGLNIFNIISSMNITGVDLSHGHELVGDSPFTQVIIDPTADVTNCSLRNLTVIGELDGLNTVRECSIGAVTNASGFFEKCAFFDTVSLNNEAIIMESYSQIAGPGYPIFNVGSNNLILRDFRGSVGIDNAQAGHISSLGVYGGRTVIESTSLGGEIHFRGDPYEIVNNSGPLCEVKYETTLNNRNALTVPKFIGLK